MTQSELLARLENDLTDLLKRVRAHFGDQPAEFFLLRPQPEKWNAAEHFAHLNAQYDFYLPRIELALHKAKARRWSPADLRRSNWLGRRAIKAVDPVYMQEKPRRSPKKLDPSRLLRVREHEMKTLLINLELLLRLVKQSQEVDINRATIKPMHWAISPFLLGDLLEYLVLHTQRHVLHAEKIRG